MKMGVDHQADVRRPDSPALESLDEKVGLVWHASVNHNVTAAVRDEDRRRPPPAFSQELFNFPLRPVGPVGPVCVVHCSPRQILTLLPVRRAAASRYEYTAQERPKEPKQAKEDDQRPLFVCLRSSELSLPN